MKMGRIKNPILYALSILLVGFLLLFTPILKTLTPTSAGDNSDYTTGEELSIRDTTIRNNTNDNPNLFSMDLPQNFEWITFFIAVCFIFFGNLKYRKTHILSDFNTRAPPCHT